MCFFGQKKVWLEIPSRVFFLNPVRHLDDLFAFLSHLTFGTCKVANADGIFGKTSPICDSLRSTEMHWSTSNCYFSFHCRATLATKTQASQAIQPARPRQLLSDPFPPCTSMQNTTNKDRFVSPLSSSSLNKSPISPMVSLKWTVELVESQALHSDMDGQWFDHLLCCGHQKNPWWHLQTRR